GEIDLKGLQGLDLEGGEACADDAAANRVDPLMEELVHLRRDLAFIKSGKDADVKQAVVQERLGTELVTSASLAAVADGENQERPLPGKTGTAELSMVGTDRAEMSEPREQVRGAAQSLLQFGPRLDGHVRTEASGREIHESPSVDTSDVHLRVFVGERKAHGRERFERDGARVREVVRGAQRQNRQVR